MSIATLRAAWAAALDAGDTCLVNLLALAIADVERGQVGSPYPCAVASLARVYLQERAA